jgi:hypothetical protein
LDSLFPSMQVQLMPSTDTGLSCPFNHRLGQSR